MAFSIKTINAFDMLKRPAACETEATRSGCRAFVAVFPPMPDKDLVYWTVRMFEIPEDLVDEDPYDGDLVELCTAQLATIEEVEARLAKWGVDSAKLDAPWKCGYPL